MSVLFCLHGPKSHHGGSTFMTSGNPNYLPETHLQMSSHWGSGLVHLGMTCVQLQAAAMSSLHLRKEPACFWSIPITHGTHGSVISFGEVGEGVLHSYANRFLEHKPHHSKAVSLSISFNRTPPQIVTASSLWKPGPTPASAHGVRKHVAGYGNGDVVQRGKRQKASCLKSRGLSL